MKEGAGTSMGLHARLWKVSLDGCVSKRRGFSNVRFHYHSAYVEER
jgi:hypothetical protein